jgi:hypothetical protein
MVCSGANVVNDSPPDLALEVDVLRSHVRQAHPGDTVLMHGEASERTIKALFGSTAATARLGMGCWHGAGIPLVYMFIPVVYKGVRLRTFLMQCFAAMEIATTLSQSRAETVIKL